MRLGPLRPVLQRLSTPARARPTFLVIGAQKSGTTSLRRYLVEHPAVLCAEPKEVHYFDWKFDRGEHWYLTHYPWKSQVRDVRKSISIEPAVGEATPDYLFYSWVPGRVHAFDPNLRFVVLLRDPVDRAYSQFQMQVRRRGESRSFEEVLALEAMEWPHEHERIRRDPDHVGTIPLHHSYVARGLYAEQLERWFALFERDRFLVLTSVELLRDTQDTMNRIAAFLGVPERDAESYERLSAGKYEPMAADTREHLARLFEPHNRELEELLGRSFEWTRPSATPAIRR
jgi:hypothetical protein